MLTIINLCERYISVHCQKSFNFSVGLQTFIMKKLERLDLYAALKIGYKEKYYLFISFSDEHIIGYVCILHNCSFKTYSLFCPVDSQ